MEESLNGLKRTSYCGKLSQETLDRYILLWAGFRNREIKEV